MAAVTVRDRENLLDSDLYKAMSPCSGRSDSQSPPPSTRGGERSERSNQNGLGVSTQMSAKEKNRQAQRRFRERQKDLIANLKQRVENLQSRVCTQDAAKAENNRGLSPRTGWDESEGWDQRVNLAVRVSFFVGGAKSLGCGLGPCRVHCVRPLERLSCSACMRGKEF